MAAILSEISLLFIPGILTIVILYGYWKKAPVYDYFITGAKDGLQTAIEILPLIIGIFIAIEALTSSGAIDFMERLIGPVFQFFGLPKELIPMTLLRPVSGSGALVLLEKLVTAYGPDGLVGRSGSVMMGSCETVFYALAIYFGATAVKNTRYALGAGLIGYLAGLFAAVFVCSIM